MPDADPPDEVGDSERPRNRLIDAPYADADGEQVADRHQEQHRQCGRREKADDESPMDRSRQDDAGDAIGNRRRGWMSRENRSRGERAFGNDWAHEVVAAGLITRGRYVVRGRVLSSTSSA